MATAQKGQLLALLALTITLGGAVYSFGMRMGQLGEQVTAQARQIDLLTAEMRAMNQHFVAFAALQAQTHRRLAADVAAVANGDAP